METTAPPIPNFGPGDIVCLKGSGVPMTVETAQTDGQGKSIVVSVVWFDKDNKLNRDVFSQTSLDLIRRNKDAQDKAPDQNPVEADQDAELATDLELETNRDIAEESNLDPARPASDRFL